MFVRNRWYVAATAAEVGRALLQRWICGEPLVLFRSTAGAVIAFGDRCPHRKAALSAGKLIGDEVECGYHGMRFDVAGRCTHVPGQTNIPPRLKAQVYPAAEKYGWIWVWIGDAAAADPALVPDYHWNESPDWKAVFGYLHVRANYQLVVDNLMDLTHETYIHPTSIGMREVAYTPITTQVEGERVLVTRLMPGCEAPPLFKKVRGLSTIDRWQRIHFEPPAHVKIDAGGLPAGTTDMSQALNWWVLNPITPETESTTHYFWALARAFERDDDELSKVIEAQIYRIFGEDIALVEQQQKMIETDKSGRPLLSVNCDAGGAAARRIVESLIGQSRAAAE
jgi:vanillate O-demethylase monooxygenase subunit